MADDQTERALAIVANTSDVRALRTMIENAVRANNDTVARAAQSRLYYLSPEHAPGTLEHDVWRCIFALEDALSGERGKTIRLGRTRQKIARVGEHRTVVDLITGKQSSGFDMMIDRDMPQFTFEAVALRHPRLFDHSTREAARRRLNASAPSYLPPQSSFTVGKLYTRPQIAEIAGLPQERRAGNWNTGYDVWNDEFFIFCNVGSAGRTGHDYPNRWSGKHLIWSGKAGTTTEQPQIQHLLSDGARAHIFWRGDDRAPFTYAGLGMPLSVADGPPVQVVWGFGEFGNDEPEDNAVWRRGPPPTVGAFQVTRESGPASVYLMRLIGADPVTFPGLPTGAVVAKVGMSSSPARRVEELNCGFPPGCRLSWQIVSTRPYSDALAAYEAEGRLLERARSDGRWIGGEFIYLQEEHISSTLE